MKLLFVFSGMPPYMNALLNKLAAKGAEVITVIPTDRSTSLGSGVKVIDSVQANYRIIETGEKKSFLSKNYFPELPLIIKQEKPDIFIAGWPYFLQIFLDHSLRKVLHTQNIRFVIREIPFQVPPFGRLHAFFKANPMYNEEMKLLSRGCSFYLRQWIIMLIRRYCYTKADGALAYASRGRTIMPTYGIDPKKVFVTYNTGDSDALLHEKQLHAAAPPILPSKSRRIIHIGRLVKWKRVDLLIDAFAMVLKEFTDAELVVIGEGPELHTLQRQTQTLGIAKNVIFTGGIYDQKVMGAYMKASTVYILAGMGGLSINDAMTYGLPVICSVCDGTEQDLVTHNVNGLFFEENNKVDLSEKIAVLFRDPSLCEKMGAASFEVIAHKINLHIVTERYMDAFRKILS